MTDLEGISRTRLRNAQTIAQGCDTVSRLRPDLWTVRGLRRPHRLVRVHRWSTGFRCQVDRHATEAEPCSHVLAVLAYEGLVDLPGAFEWRYPRADPLEDEARELAPREVPVLLSRLLREALPALVPEPVPDPVGGRPRASPYALAHQAILRAAHGSSLRSSAKQADPGNPYGPVGRSTLARFLADPATGALLDGLLALTLWPARPYDTLPGEGGLSLERIPDDHDGGLSALLLWTRRYGLVAALDVAPEPPEDAAGLMERARRLLDVDGQACDGAVPCLGGTLYSRNPTAQRHEVLCRAIAYNLFRMVYLGLERGVEIQFAGGAKAPGRGAPRSRT